MKQWKLSLILALVLSALVACDKTDKSAGGDAKTGAATTVAATGTCALVSTKDNSPIVIKVTATDTPEAK